MKKLWMALSVTLVLSLVWCAIPVFGGWSWDPIFKINGKELSVMIVPEDSDQFDPGKVKVVLKVPKGTDVEVVDDGGFKVKVKDYDKSEVKLIVRVKEGWCDEYRLKKVKVEYDGSKIKPKEKDPCKWVFKFELL